MAWLVWGESSTLWNLGFVVQALRGTLDSDRSEGKSYITDSVYEIVTLVVQSHRPGMQLENNLAGKFPPALMLASFPYKLTGRCHILKGLTKWLKSH